MKRWLYGVAAVLALASAWWVGRTGYSPTAVTQASALQQAASPSASAAPSDEGGDKAAYLATFLDRLAANVGVDRAALDQAIRDSANQTLDQVVADGDLTAQQADQRRFYSWLYRITVNAALHERRRPTTTSLNELPVQDTQPQPDELAERAEGDRELRAALQALNEREHTVIGLRYGADLSYDEIADILQVPLGTAKTWLFRAKQRLADVMERGTA